MGTFLTMATESMMRAGPFYDTMLRAVDCVEKYLWRLDSVISVTVPADKVVSYRQPGTAIPVFGCAWPAGLL